MVTVVTRNRPKTKKRSYGLFLSLLLTTKQRDRDIAYTIKIKRIPREAEMTVEMVKAQDGFLYKWTWYETEIE